MASISDIARIAGVSIATVSNVLNERGRFSDATRERVLRIAREQGYIASASLRGRASQRIHTVGIITPDVSNDYFSTIVLTIEYAMYQQGYSSFICNTAYDEERTTDRLRELTQRNVDGFFFVGCEVMGDIGIVGTTPCALIGHNVSAWPQRYFLTKSDMAEIVMDQACLLFGRGCRRIALLALTDADDATERDPIFSGYRRFLDESGIDFDQSLLFVGRHELGSRADARTIVSKALERGIAFDGIAAVGDRLALGACEALLAREVDVGNAVKVVGMDDSLYSQLGIGGISTVERHPEMMAHAAVGAMLTMLQGKNPTEREVIIPHGIIERATTLGA